MPNKPNSADNNLVKPNPGQQPNLKPGNTDTVEHQPTYTLSLLYQDFLVHLGHSTDDAIAFLYIFCCRCQFILPIDLHAQIITYINLYNEGDAHTGISRDAYHTVAIEELRRILKEGENKNADNC